MGLWETIVEEDVLKGLSEIAKLTSFIQKKGLIIMLDEAEGIEKLTPHQRQYAYENIQFLIENTGRINNAYFLYATTPTFFNDVETYSMDLANIVSTAAHTDLAPLSNIEVKMLFSKVVDIYLASKGAMDNDSIRKTLQGRADLFLKTCSVNRSISIRDMITGLIRELHKIVSA